MKNSHFSQETEVVPYLTDWNNERITIIWTPGVGEKLQEVSVVGHIVWGVKGKHSRG